MITKDELKARFINACDEVIAAEAELTEIDSHFGDADHGVTMTKIANAIKEGVDEAEGGIQAMLDEAGCNVMMINGGSAVPLWNTWLDAMQENSVTGDEMSVAELKTMFQEALDELAALSKAKVGDKTMMDSMIPATEALVACEGDVDALFQAAAEAAIAGCEASKGFVSKFGRARSYGEQTIGTPDAGACSMKYFWVGLAKK